MARIVIEDMTPDEFDVRMEKTFMKVVSAIPQVKEERFLTREEISEILHLSTVSIDKYARNGKLRAHRIGNRVLFKLSEVNFDRIPVRKYPGK